MRPEGIAALRIDVTGKIDATLADLVARSLAQYPGHHVELAVNCEGDDWAAAVAIFGLARGHQRRVTASIRRAASAGALIIMAADHRVLDPAGSIWLHWPVPTAGPGTVDQKALDEVASTKAILMSQCCRVPAEQFLRWMRATTLLDAKRSLDVGLVHAVPGLTKHSVAFI